MLRWIKVPAQGTKHQGTDLNSFFEAWLQEVKISSEASKVAEQDRQARQAVW